ncbi:GNAT family N-acetyltransferase [Hominifimenecus sp. rT4P-3]|uniref:GNAT family N-acetyltransferase n=1 Tax=Hominifimenecus sp. rT4P-3 TaxID=3242979 RepID=UPI003DA30B04
MNVEFKNENLTYKTGVPIPVDVYNRMRLAFGWTEIDPAQVVRGFQNSDLLLSVWDQDRPVGTARTVSDGGYMVLIVDVMVDPEYQGRGIGREFMERILTYYREHTLPEETRMINLMAAFGKEGFYQKFGFEERPNPTGGAGMVLWMRPQPV